MTPSEQFSAHQITTPELHERLSALNSENAYLRDMVNDLFLTLEPAQHKGRSR